MQFRFKKALYEKRALFSAAYKFTDRAFLHLDADDQDYIVDVEMKPGAADIQPEQFQNEILAAVVRMEISQRTKNVRELLLARALASTVVMNAEEAEEEGRDDPEEIKDILADWFEKYE